MLGEVFICLVFDYTELIIMEREWKSHIKTKNILSVLKLEYKLPSN